MSEQVSGNFNPDAVCGRVQTAATRRDFLARTGMGLGALALEALLQETLATPASAATNPLAAHKPPMPAKAKAVIHIFAGGAPSHIDTFDPKPALEKYRDESLPGKSGVGFPSPFKFEAKGKNGLLMSELFPHLGDVSDNLCVIRSMFTDVPAHGPAAKLIHTGSLVLTKPSLGSWVLYGLGTENLNLPGFVTLGGSVDHRQAAFLPSLFQGSRADFAPYRPVDKVLLNLKNEFRTTDEAQQLQLGLAGKLNQQHQQLAQHDEQLEARIQSFELAFHMQAAATDAFDISKEPLAVRERYGKGDLAGKLLCARRLVERGVRFVQIEAGGWDHHNNLYQSIQRTSQAIDRPAALIADLKERGLLDSTLIIWGGEFGRTPSCQGRVDDNAGRDHHSGCFTTWLAGGGTKGGFAYGATDDIGMTVAENGVHVHDLHATILQLLGFDHTKLTYRYNGRDFRLTDNYGKIVDGVIA